MVHPVRRLWNPCLCNIAPLYNNLLDISFFTFLFRRSKDSVRNLARYKRSDCHSRNTEIQETLLLLLLSRFNRVQLCATPETAAHQGPPSLGFSRQEHWSGLPFPSPTHESEKWKWKRSRVQLFETPWTAAYQAPPSMGFSRQGYWSGVPLPSLMGRLKQFCG